MELHGISVVLGKLLILFNESSSWNCKSECKWCASQRSLHKYSVYELKNVSLSTFNAFHGYPMHVLCYSPLFSIIASSRIWALSEERSGIKTTDPAY